MVNFKNLSNVANKAKETVGKRGGTDALKRDAEQLKGIAKGSGSLSDKAKAAVSALKEPGAEAGKGAEATESAGSPEAPISTTKPGATPKQAAGKAKVDAAKKTGTSKGTGKRPAEEVGGAK